MTKRSRLCPNCGEELPHEDSECFKDFQKYRRGMFEEQSKSFAKIATREISKYLIALNYIHVYPDFFEDALRKIGCLASIKLGSALTVKFNKHINPEWLPFLQNTVRCEFNDWWNQTLNSSNNHLLANIHSWAIVCDETNNDPAAFETMRAPHFDFFVTSYDTHKTFQLSFERFMRESDHNDAYKILQGSS
jgi:hypothetical protein